MNSSMQCRLLSVHRASLRSTSRRACSPRPFPPCPPSSRHQSIRKLHPTPAHRNSTREPQCPADSSCSNSISERPSSTVESESRHDTTESRPSADATDYETPQTKSGKLANNTNKEFTPYGSAIRRSMRHRRPSDPPKPVASIVPSWFHERNIHTSEDLRQLATSRNHEVAVGKSAASETEASTQKLAHGGDGGEDKGSPDESPSGYRYVLSKEIWDELYASVNAGLTLPASQYADEPSATKAHLVLQYPGDGGILFLDAIVKKLAGSVGANLVTINAQDIAEMYSEQGKDIASSSSPLSLLGFEVYQPTEKAMPKEEEEMEERDEEDAEDEDADLYPKRGKSMPVARFSGPASSVFSQLFGGGGGGGRGRFGSLGVAKIILPQGRDLKIDLDQTDELQCSRLIEKLISVSRQRPTTTPVLGKEDAAAVPEDSTANETESLPTDLVIQIQDYGEILSTRVGTGFMTLLHRAVQEKRRDGHRIIIVGTVSANEGLSPPSGVSTSSVPRDYDRFSKTILVTPAMNSQVVERVFTEDSKKRVLEINIRHFQQILRTRLKESADAEPSLLNERNWALDAGLVEDSGLDTGYWAFDHIHRIVTVALGGRKWAEPLCVKHIQFGIYLLERSDKVRSEWFSRQSTKAKGSHSRPFSDKARKAQLRAKCNSYEQKLLNGVVDAEHIRTTFSDVHVPPDTVEALKTLTSLSLARPEEFKYGVLATDKIPGLLLYGPPGTGKTMLAKAVARESGATVLEVSGSDVYDMYVGEGEKNVRAIFTLAKKLSPCVVFIDEADAIFCSRTGGHNRPSHRELINQFLREWDGMDDLSAFIMVATNRPFDLDDAVLRRLPRRLLVDLPSEEARLAILKIHLKNEQLEPSVDLADLARRTPFYSGSDLKNLSVSAALACVREEYDKAARYDGSEPYKYPERRMLRREHFEKALDEISASISEDMSSLAAVRKFDEKYGDRKGRRKKSSGWGFTHPSDAESTVETGRVRN